MRVQTDVFLLQMTDRQNNTDRVYQAVGTVGKFFITCELTYEPIMHSYV